MIFILKIKLSGLSGNCPSHKDRSGSGLPIVPAQFHMGHSIRMFSCTARDRQVSPEPYGRNEGHFNNFNCRHFPPEDCHISLRSKGDHTSDTSGSSYRTALCSEEAESFKDCIEFFEEPGERIKQCTYCDSEYERDDVTATPVCSATQPNLAGRDKISRGTDTQLHGTFSSLGKAIQDPYSANSKEEADTSVAPPKGIQSHFVLNGTKSFGGSSTVQDASAQSLQADSNGTVKDQTCRDRPYPSDKESQQVHMSVKAKNSSDPACGGRMGPVTRRLQPGDSGSRYLDHSEQFGSEKSKEMLPNVRKPKKNSLGSRAHGPVSSKAVCPKYFDENLSVMSDSDEADNEVEKLTALSFQSLSCPQGSYLDMYSSSNRTSSSLSNSLPEDSIGVNRWPTCGDPRKTVVANHAKGNWSFPSANKAPEKDLRTSALGKERVECVDVTLDSADVRKNLCKKRMVPKRQIQLRRKEKKEAGCCAASDCVVLQPFTQPRKETGTKGRTTSDEFRLNYKQFMRAACQSNSYSKTRMASSLVKNVLAKKMQYEQRIKTEQASVRGSSTSSVPSSVSTDLQGDSLEGKSSSLSKSDCSFSTEDVQSHSTSERSDPVAVSREDVDALRPTKGVVLNEQLRENVCKLKKTFNELNERMKYQESSQLMRCPVMADDAGTIGSSNMRKQAAGERKEYRRARAVFESMQDEAKDSGAVRKFARTPKPWPNLKQRAIRQNKHPQPKEEKIPVKSKSFATPKDASRNIFTSKTKEMKLIPQATNEQTCALNAFKHRTSDRVSSNSKLPAVPSTKFSSLVFPTSGKLRCDETPLTDEALHMENKGKLRKRQQRDVRKLVNDNYSPGFKASDSSSAEQLFYSESKHNNSQIGSPRDTATAISPLFIRCSSVRRKEDAQAGNQAQERKRVEIRDADVSTLSLHDRRISSTDHVNPTPQAPGNVSTCHLEDRCCVVGEPAVHITTIQSRKSVSENKELQPKAERKPVTYERTELNVRPSSAPTKKESQLNIKVNSSVSKQSHKTETDYFPAFSCSAPEERTTKEALSQPNHGFRSSSSETIVIPSSNCLQEIRKKDNGRVMVDNIYEPPKAQNSAVAHQKHVSSETISVVPKDNAISPSFLKEENVFSGLTHGSSRHPEFIRPTVTSFQNNQAQTPANSCFVDSSSETAVLEDPTPLGNNDRIPSEDDISESPLPTREYTEGIRRTSNPPFTPSSSYGKLHDPGWDDSNKHHTVNEQYFSAAQAESTNYLTIPVKPHQSETSSKLPTPSFSENSSFTSNVSFQPSGEVPGNKASKEHFPPKQLERKAPSDNLLHSNPSHRQIPPRLEESPSFIRRNERISPSGKSAPSPTRHFAASLQAHRKMLVDPASGKCYYVESPRQTQLKMLYDPETGQYIEVLIPPAPLTSHSGLYQPPFPSVVMNPGSYGPPYMSYSGFSGFPPPPPAVPPVQVDLQDQPPVHENADFSESFGHFPKNEALPATQTADGNYMESLYYIPTGMNSSPNPNQAAFPPPANSGLSMPEKGSFLRM